MKDAAIWGRLLAVTDTAERYENEVQIIAGRPFAEINATFWWMATDANYFNAKRMKEIKSAPRMAVMIAGGIYFLGLWTMYAIVLRNIKMKIAPMKAIKINIEPSFRKPIIQKSIKAGSSTQSCFPSRWFKRFKKVNHEISPASGKRSKRKRWKRWKRWKRVNHPSPSQDQARANDKSQKPQRPHETKTRWALLEWGWS